MSDHIDVFPRSEEVKHLERDTLRVQVQMRDQLIDFKLKYRKIAEHSLEH